MDKNERETKEMELEVLSDRPVSPVMRHQSDKGLASKKEGSSDLKSSSTSDLPIAPTKRHVSIQSDEAKGGPRTSTQMSRKPRKSTDHPRKSAEFDRRTDGPFGRPSITMTRRESLQPALDTDVEGVPGLSLQPSADGHPVEPESSREIIPVQLEPPPLNYDLWSRKWWILGTCMPHSMSLANLRNGFWSLVVFDSVVCPVALYFGLWYGLYVHDKMSANTVFSIVTAAVGGASIIEYFLRLWKLVRKNSNCRVIDGKRFWLDSFHWNFTLGWIVIMIELIVGTVQEYPPPRLIAMVVPTMGFVFAVEMLVLDALRYFEIPAPIRLSSIPKGAQVRPGIYTIIEDVVAVDGSGGTAYREALNLRYEASHTFRAMLRRLGLFWSIGSMAMAVLSTILVFTLETDYAYVIGWTLPFVWAGLWALLTVWYVKRTLKAEKIAWREALDIKTTTV